MTCAVDETEDTWGQCDNCGCKMTGCKSFPPLDPEECEDILCIPCGHYTYWERMKEEPNAA